MMKRKPQRPAIRPSVWLPVAVTFAAVFVSAVAVIQALRVARHLPQVRIEALSQLEPQWIAAAQRVGLQRGSADARRAYAQLQLSVAAFNASRDPAALATFRTSIGTQLARLNVQDLGRLYQTLNVMLVQEQRNESIDTWWPYVQAYLPKSDGPDLRHHTRTLYEAWATAFEARRTGAGLAYELASELAGNWHSSFLQLWVPRFEQLIAERQAAGDDAGARLCRRTLHLLLRQWVLEPGAPGLRLLSADLLSRSLITATDPSDQATQIAGELLEWRELIRRELRERRDDLFALRGGPCLVPDTHDALARRLVLMTWLGSACLMMFVPSVVLGWRWFRGAGGRPSGIGIFVSAGITTGVVLVGGLLWTIWMYDDVRHDLRSDWSSVRYYWRHPFVAGGLAFVSWIVAGLVRRGGGSRPRFARLGATALTAWLLLAVGTWLATLGVHAAREGYDGARWAALQDPIAAVAGEPAEKLLEGLRRWVP